MTQLGGMGIIFLTLIMIKLFAQCLGVDSSYDDEPSNSSFFRLHEAFQAPFSKMLGQGFYVVFVIAILDIVNV